MKRLAFCLLLLPAPTLAHSSGQGFVLLLPTGLYMAGGIAAVVLTVALLAVVPPGTARRIFTPRAISAAAITPARDVAPPLWSAAVAFAVFALLVLAGFTGAHDPTRNPLPVVVWTFVWLHLVIFAGFIGNPWPYFTPWALPLAVIGHTTRILPTRLGHWPALPSLAAIAALLLIHPAPSDPHTLATFTLAYFIAHLALALWFGPGWLARGEALTVLFATFAQLAPLTRHAIGPPGWQALARPTPDMGLALFMVALLAIGSFDGLAKTFFWLGLIGVNPLEFAGRSAVVGVNGAGLALALPVLALAYAACLALGNALVGARGLRAAFCAFAPTLLPIAFAYHLAHFLPTLLVETQLIPGVLNDPFGTGATLLGLHDPHVTTGFLNRLDTVRLIWLTQAGAIVAGHMLAIAMAHRVALDRTTTHRRAVISQLPLAAFMVLYTLFGLWLLASPQGA